MREVRAASRPRARSRAALVALAGVVATLLTVAATPAAAADPALAVLDWNMHAYNALGNPPNAAIPGVGQPPNVAIQHLAMVQGAVYDAVNSITGGYQPYLEGLPAASPTASLPAAVATAAHHVLVDVEIEPPLTGAIVERLNMLYDESLLGIADGPDKEAGIAAGAAAATAMLAARADDGRFEPFFFTNGDEVGEWRPAPPAGATDQFAWTAFVDPFTLESADQFRTKGPLPLNHPLYAREYNEVKDFGSATDSARGPEEQAVAQFFTVNPVEMYSRNFRTLAAGLSMADQARLFAQLNIAGADALINCWNDKAHFSNWRPITAIHQGDDDGNTRTDGDEDWVPFSATPPYPDHSSGYNCVTGAWMNTAWRFFGTDKVSFDLVRIAPGVPNVTRHYDQFTDVIDDTIDARVYQGIHFRTADVQGAQLGRKVAFWVDQHFFRRA